MNTSDSGPLTPSEKLDRKLMVIETSPIPGATAQVIPAASTTNAQPTAGYCVTDAGYCPLAAATPAGLNCLCHAGNLAYGGTTGAAPQTFEPQ